MEDREHTLVVLSDDTSRVLAAYRVKNNEVLYSFLALIRFLGFDKYYLKPEKLR